MPCPPSPAYWLLPEAPPVDGAVPVPGAAVPAGADGVVIVPPVVPPAVPPGVAAGGVAAGGVALGAGAVAAGAEVFFWASLPWLSQAARPRTARGTAAIHNLVRMNSSGLFGAPRKAHIPGGHLREQHERGSYSRKNGDKNAPARFNSLDGRKVRLGNRQYGSRTEHDDT
jgi:hypothetical protein